MLPRRPIFLAQALILAALCSGVSSARAEEPTCRAGTTFSFNAKTVDVEAVPSVDYHSATGEIFTAVSTVNSIKIAIPGSAGEDVGVFARSNTLCKAKTIICGLQFNSQLVAALFPASTINKIDRWLVILVDKKEFDLDELQEKIKTCKSVSLRIG